MTVHALATEQKEPEHSNPRVYSIYRRQQLVRIIHHMSIHNESCTDVPSFAWLAKVLNHCPDGILIGDNWNQTINNAALYLLYQYPSRQDFREDEKAFLRFLINSALGVAV